MKEKYEYLTQEELDRLELPTFWQFMRSGVVALLVLYAICSLILWAFGI